MIMKIILKLRQDHSFGINDNDYHSQPFAENLSDVVKIWKFRAAIGNFSVDYHSQLDLIQ